MCVCLWSQIMNTEIEQLQNAHTHTQARLADYKRKLTNLAHRLLKVRAEQISMCSSEMLTYVR